jgi:flavin-dependent dehydrogenase
MIHKTTNNVYDCVVVGGGPAGSTTAALVADAGYKALLIEREKMPRIHVGESLMPETHWTLKRLGLLETLRTSRFTKKVGVQFVSPFGGESQPFYFEKHDASESAHTWHVERAEFDKLLFDNAAAKGAECLDETRAISVELSTDDFCKVQIRLPDGTVRDVRCKVLVDATGQQAFLANRLGLQVANPDLRKAAIWGHFRGARRNNNENAELTTIIHTTNKQSWFWYIPLSDDKVSVGLVSDNEYLLKGRGTPDEVFNEERQHCLALNERLLDSKQVGQLRIGKEFSYTSKQHAGDGWVLVGDAYGFIDPIYSTGVFLALKSGELAADSIVDGLRTGDVSAGKLGEWTDEFNRGVQLFRKLVDAFYTPEFSFADFIKQYPHYQGNLTDLLIGRVFRDNVGLIFADLDPVVKAAQQRGKYTTDDHT